MEAVERPKAPFWNRFTQSMCVTLIVSLVVTTPAYPLAYFLAFVAHRRRYVLLLVLLAPFFTSFLLRVLAWQVMLNDNGVINSALWELGACSDGQPLEISWLFHTWFSVGLVLGLLVDPVRRAADLRGAREHGPAADRGGAGSGRQPVHDLPAGHAAAVACRA